MSFWNRKKEEVPQIKKKLREYYTLDRCYRCKQLIINGIHSSTDIEEPSFRELYGTQIIGYKSETIVDDWLVTVNKQFGIHWKCPDHQVEIPEDIKVRANVQKFLDSENKQ